VSGKQPEINGCAITISGRFEGPLKGSVNCEAANGSTSKSEREEYIVEKYVVLDVLLIAITITMIVCVFSAFSKIKICEIGEVIGWEQGIRVNQYESARNRTPIYEFTYTVRANDHTYYSVSSCLDTSTTKRFEVGDQVVIWKKGFTGTTAVLYRRKCEDA